MNASISQQRYLVGAGAGTLDEIGFALVHASSEDEAISKYIDVAGLTEDIFLEHVYTQSTQLSFAENFWWPDDDETEEVDDSDQVDRQEFERRVREYFGDRKAFADLYLDYYFNMEEDLSSNLFPSDMLFYIWLRSDWADVVAIPFDDVEVIE